MTARKKPAAKPDPEPKAPEVVQPTPLVSGVDDLREKAAETVKKKGS